MLIRLVVENFLSFNGETEFNMLTSDVRRHSHHVYKFKKCNLVKTSVIYGANGAGKSNLLLAFQLLKEIVTEGNLFSYHKENKFKFNAADNLPTKLEVEFIMKGKIYNYGIQVNNDIIEEEWLYKIGHNTEDERIFERKFLKNNKSKINFHPSYTANPKTKLLLEVLKDDFLESDVPFLFVAKFKKFIDIDNVFNWFDNNTLLIFPGTTFVGLPSLLHHNDDFRSFSNNLISKLNTGISTLEVIEIDFDGYFGDDNLDLKENILKRLKNGEEEIQIGTYPNVVIVFLQNDVPVVKKLISYHQNDEGDRNKFELHEESTGTLRLLDFLPVLYHSIHYPITIFIDEIDQSIHPSLLKEFVKLIQENKYSKGQIIFTTHESNLLDLELFRQDEIWFAEKNKKGATEFYIMSDFDIRPDLDIRKGYLSGRFGAIPFLANLKDLNWDIHAKEAKQSVQKGTIS